MNAHPEAIEPLPPEDRVAPPAHDGSTPPLAALRRGDPAAFEDLVQANGARMLAVARRLLRNEDDARDAVQEAFLLAFKGLGEFREQCQMSTWLHRIVVNAALMKMRSRKRKPESPIEPLLPQFQPDGHHVTRFEEWRMPPLQRMMREEVRAQVRAAIDQLPEGYRTVLMLRDIEELETAEVAGMLGVSPNAVKIRLHRARQALRTLLDPIFAGGRGHAHERPISD